MEAVRTDEFQRALGFWSAQQNDVAAASRTATAGKREPFFTRQGSVHLRNHYDPLLSSGIPNEFQEESRSIRRVLSFRAGSPEIFVPKGPNGISAGFWKACQLLAAEIP